MASGLDPDAFWIKTPYEASLILEGRGEALDREHNEFAWLAWHIAALPRMKVFPKLKDLQSRTKASSRKEMSPDLQWALMSRMG